MQELTHDSTPATDWERLRPVIDDALHALDERDREAVLMRYFEGRPFAEVGAKLSLSEDTARVRVSRALDKMHALLARRGVTSTSAALAVALANQAAAAVPAGLAVTVTGSALAGAAGAGSATAWLVFLTMNKIKIGIVVAILLAALTPVLVELRANQTLSAELKSLQADGAEVQTENTRLLATLAKVGARSTVPNESADLAKLRARAALLRRRPEGVVEAEMRAPTNAGFATAEAAFETMNWAAVNGDWETLAKTWAFAGENKTTGDAFFAGLSLAAREKYGTPERALAHGLLASGSMLSRSGWMTAMQVYDTRLVDGPASMQVLIWQRQGGGNEFANGGIFERAAGGGWVAGQPGVTKILNMLIPRLDPVTGELLPKSP